MVNSADPDKAAERPFRLNLHMHLFTWSTCADFKDVYSGLLRRLISTTEPEAQHLRQKASRRFEFAQGKLNRREAVDSHLDGHGTLAPRAACQFPGFVYEF